MGDWDGRPQNPERDGLHYITDAVALWIAHKGKWALLARTRYVSPEWLAAQTWAQYRGRCHTPAEVAALTEWRDEPPGGISKGGVLYLSPERVAAQVEAARREGIAAAAIELRGMAARMRKMDLVDLQVLANAATLEQAADALAELPAARKLTGLEYRGG